MNASEAEKRVKERWAEAQAVWTSRGWRVFIPGESPTGRLVVPHILGRTESAHVPESDAWLDAAQRMEAEK